MSEQSDNVILKLFSLIRESILASFLTLASIGGILFGIFVFIFNTKATNKDVPEIKSMIQKHEAEDAEDKKQFINILNDVKISIGKVDSKTDLINQKVDDMKAYGVGGEYHRATKDAINKTKK